MWTDNVLSLAKGLSFILRYLKWKKELEQAFHSVYVKLGSRSPRKKFCVLPLLFSPQSRLKRWKEPQLGQQWGGRLERQHESVLSHCSYEIKLLYAKKKGREKNSKPAKEKNSFPGQE